MRFRFPAASGDRLGAHISTKGGLSTMFARAKAIDAGALAMFTKNSNQWNAKPLTEEDCAQFAAVRREAGMSAKPLMSHASYLINLATTNPEFHAKSLLAMADELQRAERLGCFAVVLHPGAHMGAGVDVALDQIARSLDQVHAAVPDCKVVTLLETAAGQGSCVGCSFDELRRVVSIVDDPARVGVCVDTCHIFAAGYDITTRDGYEKTMDELLETVGIENVGAFHLNDSKKGLGSRVDRHEHIGDGALGLAPFEFLLNDDRFAHVPKVLETPKSEKPLDENLWDIRNLTTLRGLLGGRAPSPALPDTLRKSRRKRVERANAT